MDLKKTLAGIGAAAALVGGGTVATDAVINPYEVSSEKYEIQAESVMESAGENKVEVKRDRPAVVLSKWNGAAQMTVSYNDVKASGERQFLTNRVEWKEEKKEVHAYPLAADPETMEEGGFEIEVVLNEKPESNRFDFTIEDAEELDFFYQSELWREAGFSGPTPECTDTQCTISGDSSNRPENVVGSYAVYHKTKRDFARGGMNYATGKVYHIYRPKAIDAKGVEQWGELHYNEGILSVTVPQEFLDNAKYPVRVDPTFGNTIQGGTVNGWLENTVRAAAPFTPDFTGTVNSIWIRDSNATNSGFARGVIYASSTLALVDTGTEANLDAGSAAGAWLEYDMNDQTVTGGTAYTLGLWVDATPWSSIRSDTVAGFGISRDDLTYHATNPPNDPFVIDAALGTRLTIFAEYTYAGTPGTHKQVDTYLASATWYAPPDVTSVDVEAWGAGGGGTTATGSGGGGAFVKSTGISVTPGADYAVVVGAGASNTNGATSTFNGTTVVAQGGRSGTNGGAGGQASLSTGDTKFSGGNGFASTTSVSGAGAAGDAANGTDASSATLSRVIGGANNGGFGSQPSGTDIAGTPAGGGASDAAAGDAGARGEVRITYTTSSPDSAASVADRSWGRSTTNVTSLAMNMPSGITAGELLIAVVTNDGNATSGIDGWTQMGTGLSGTAIRSTVFYKTAAGSDTATATTSASESIEYVVYRIKNGGTPSGTSANSTGSNPNPPSHNAGSSATYLWLALASQDMGFVGNYIFGGCPTSYTSCIFEAGFGAGGATHMAVSDRFRTIQTEDPAAFTMPSPSSDGWVAWTVAVPYSAPSAGTPNVNPHLYLRNGALYMKDGGPYIKQ